MRSLTDTQRETLGLVSGSSSVKSFTGEENLGIDIASDEDISTMEFFELTYCER